MRLLRNLCDFCVQLSESDLFIRRLGLAPSSGNTLMPRLAETVNSCPPPRIGMWLEITSRYASTPSNGSKLLRCVKSETTRPCSASRNPPVRRPGRASGAAQEHDSGRVGVARPPVKERI